MKLIVKVTENERQAIKLLASDLAWPIDMLVANKVQKCMAKLRNVDPVDVGSLVMNRWLPIDISRSKSAGMALGRPIILELDLSEDAIQVIEKFCDDKGILVEHLILFSIVDYGVEGEEMTQHGHQGKGTLTEPPEGFKTEMPASPAESPWETANREVKKYFAYDLGQYDPDERVAIGDAYVLFKSVANEISQLETALLSLGQEENARELGNYRYHIHAMYRKFKAELEENNEPTC